MDAASALRENLLDKLRSHAWRPGQRLPTERELGAQFGLSRSTVRRVLQDFKRKRLITQTVGSGTYVSDEAHEALSAQALLAPHGAAHAVSPADLMNASYSSCAYVVRHLFRCVFGHAYGQTYRYICAQVCVQTCA